MYIIDDGIVIRDMNMKESDKYLTILTRAHGKLRVKAPGAKGTKSRMLPSAQLFAYSNFTLFENRGYYTINQAELLDSFFGLSREVTALSLASYFAELLNAVGDADSPSGDLLRLTLNALYALANAKSSERVVKPAFEMRMMALAGFEPDLDACAVCGEEPKKPMLSLSNGVLHCAECRPFVGGSVSMPLPRGALDAMRYILDADLKKIFSFALRDEELRALSETAEIYTLTQLERPFQTLDFYKTMTGEPSL